MSISVKQKSVLAHVGILSNYSLTHAEHKFVIEIDQRRTQIIMLILFGAKKLIHLSAATERNEHSN